MADEQNPGGTPPAQAAAPAADEIKNLKAEIDRKLGNVTSSLNQFMEQMKQQVVPTAPKQEKKLSELIYEDADAYTAKVIEEAERRVETKLSKRDELMQKQQQVINTLVSDFPELSQTDSDLTKKALEIYNSLSNDEKANPLAYRTAVKEAALDLGVKPKSKRTTSSDDSFSLGTEAPRKPAKTDKLDEATTWFAEMLGRDPKKVQEVSKKRKNYNSWE
jgi:phage terminase small subunit